jgi:hypothetical protein
VRGLLLVLAVLGASAAGWLLLAGETLDQRELEDAGGSPFDEGGARAQLQGRPTPAPRQPAAGEAAGSEGGAPTADAGGRVDPAVAEPFLVGRVLAADDGRPLVGARIGVEPASSSLPRLPQRGAWLLEDGVTLTDAEGRFRVMRAPAGGPPVDVFVLASGHVGAASGPHARGDEVEFRLVRGHELTGVVRGPRGRLLEGARLVARPAPGTRPSMEHIATAVSDERGEFTLGGLGAGAVIVRCEHPTHLPAESEPVDAAVAPPLAFDLVAGLEVTFELVPTDATEPLHPTVEFRTTGPTAEGGLVLLRPPLPMPGDEGKLPGVWTYQPLLVPCRAPAVTFVVKAEQHAVWRSEPIALPEEGGRTTVRVPLEPAAPSAQARVAFRDRDGQVVPYGGLGASLELVALDLQELPAGAIVEGSAELVLRSVPAGRYRLGIRSAAYAPVTVEVEASALEMPATEVELEAAAKVRVVFRAIEPMTVPFRIYEAGRPIAVFPEGGAKAATGDEALVGGRSEGDVFSGLGTGTYEIRVTSDQLRAPATSFRAYSGETVDVEIDVERR